MKTYQFVYNNLENGTTHAIDIKATNETAARKKFCRETYLFDTDIIGISEVDDDVKDEYTEDDLGPNWW